MLLNIDTIYFKNTKMQIHKVKNYELCFLNKTRARVQVLPKAMIKNRTPRIGTC